MARTGRWERTCWPAGASVLSCMEGIVILEDRLLAAFSVLHRVERPFDGSRSGAIERRSPSSDASTFPNVAGRRARGAVGLDKVKNEGSDFVKILSRLSRESYFAIAEESRKDQIHFVGHVPDAISASEASNAGQYSIEHLTGISLACSSQETELREKILAAMSMRDRKSVRIFNQQAAATYDAKKAAALFSTFISNNTWQVPTLIWTKTQSTLEATKWDTDPRLKYVPASDPQTMGPQRTLKANSARNPG